MKLDKQTAIVVGASTFLGYFGDALTYSIAESKGKKFSWSWPQGSDIWKIVLAGIISGFVIDYAVKQIQWYVMTKEERAMANLVEKEVEMIRTGQREGVMPASIQWTKVQAA